MNFSNFALQFYYLPSIFDIKDKQMKNLLIVIILLSVASLPLNAQSTSIHGTLRAAGDLPINIAHVHVSNSESYKAKPTTYTVNEDGTFSFSLTNGWYRLPWQAGCRR